MDKTYYSYNLYILFEGFVVYKFLAVEQMDNKLEDWSPINTESAHQQSNKAPGEASNFIH